MIMILYDEHKVNELDNLSEIFLQDVIYKPCFKTGWCNIDAFQCVYRLWPKIFLQVKFDRTLDWIYKRNDDI